MIKIIDGIKKQTLMPIDYTQEISKDKNQTNKKKKNNRNMLLKGEEGTGKDMN